jgi:hypothetical protein
MTMTIPELLATNPSLETLRGYALVLSPELNTAFNAIQAGLGERQFEAQTRELTDGRFMLGADLLSEIGSGGMYYVGFAAIPSELLDLVEVLPIAEALALLPPSFEEE